jgi:hypothetical protein
MDKFVVCPFCDARDLEAGSSQHCAACSESLVIAEDQLDSNSRCQCPACEQRYELTSDVLDFEISCTSCETRFAVVRIQHAHLSTPAAVLPKLTDEARATAGTKKAKGRQRRLSAKRPAH